MSDKRPITMLCFASEFKGLRFIEQSKKEGCHVILLTREKWKDEPWPMDSIDERFLMPDLSNRENVFNAVSYLMRSHPIDCINPLDDFDVEMVAALREHLCIPGQGESAARHFRDKLTMRIVARDAGINVPEFTPVFNYDALREWMARVSPPWVLKPRSSAGSMGIKKVASPEEVWRLLDQLGDQQSHYHLEQFVPGDVFHADSLVDGGQVIFSIAHRYGVPPMSVYHGGGIFTTRTMPRDGKDTQAILALNEKVIIALGMERGANHIEFIKGQDGQLYFLEAAARVGGANISDLIEYAAGINLWAEWARLEVAHARGEKYELPSLKHGYAGVMQCLAKQEWPDLSGYDDPEIVWRLKKQYHAGLIVVSPDAARVETLLDGYADRFAQDFLAVAPPLEKPPA